MKATVEVTQFVTVEVPDSLLTEEFMEEFRGYMYDFDTREDHLIHLAEMYARGMIAEHSFIEGYGRAQDHGIKFETEDVQTKLESVV